MKIAMLNFKIKIFKYIIMNRNLIILGVAGIFVLLSLLNILRRDNNNTGFHAVYGPKGTDDLPQDPIADLKDTSKGYWNVVKDTSKGYWNVVKDTINREEVEKPEPKFEEFRNINEFANDNLDILKNNKCYPGCCPGTYTCDVGCVCMTSAQKQLVGNRRGGNRTQYDHNNDF